MASKGTNWVELAPLPATKPIPNTEVMLEEVMMGYVMVGIGCLKEGDYRKAEWRADILLYLHKLEKTNVFNFNGTM